jgi:hypothetical protein
LEAAVGGGRRIDIEVGYTVIEVKKDLRAAGTKAEAIVQLTGYVAVEPRRSAGSSFQG